MPPEVRIKEFYRKIDIETSEEENDKSRDYDKEIFFIHEYRLRRSN
jgi:hypothetical protein